MRQTSPIHRDIPETADEADLRHLYPHPDGMVRLGMIAAASGEASGPDGSSRSLTGPEDLRVLRALRAGADVVLVGARTARLEGYGPIRVPAEWKDSRDGLMRPAPVVAVVTFTGSLPVGLTPENSLAITTIDSPAATALAATWGDSLLAGGFDDFSPRLIIDALRAHGFTRVLCEGGPSLARLLLDHGVVSDYCVTSSPHHGGPSAPLVPPVPEGWQLAHVLEAGGFTMRRWSNPQG